MCTPDKCKVVFEAIWEEEEFKRKLENHYAYTYKVSSTHHILAKHKWQRLLLPDYSSLGHSLKRKLESEKTGVRLEGKVILTSNLIFSNQTLV